MRPGENPGRWRKPWGTLGRMSRPDYDAYTNFEQDRAAKADVFARQAIATTRPWLSKPLAELDVLDVGSGYGHTAAALASQSRSVVGLEPMSDLHAKAETLAADVPNLSFIHGGVEDLEPGERFDLVLLDNVYEHLPDQQTALDRISAVMRPGAVLYLLMPNKLWPIEAHYKLPGLSWLPLSAANRYLRWSGRGRDYTDASYAPTYWQLRGALDRHPEWEWAMTLPGDPTATKAGAPVHYRAGMAALGRVPALWAISKAFLVVARRR